MNRLLVGVGAALVVAGLLWPSLKWMNMVHLPGDVVIDRPGFKFFFSAYDNVDSRRAAIDHCVRLTERRTRSQTACSRAATEEYRDSISGAPSPCVTDN